MINHTLTVPVKYDYNVTEEQQTAGLVLYSRTHNVAPASPS